MSSGKIVFGPVPSRRLGMSLGINNVYHKYCSYSCVYCQAGRTTNLTINRRPFYGVRRVVESVIDALSKPRVTIDYITFVPNGEPTLDKDLGEEIRHLKKSLDCRIAVISNASLIWRTDVANDLINSDLVSVKVDAGTSKVYQVINRPHPLLSLSTVIKGIKEFSRNYTGTLISETMLVAGINDSVNEIRRIADIIRIIEPSKAYVMIPVRPPAEGWVKPPHRNILEEAIRAITAYLGRGRVALLANIEESPKGFVGDDVIDSIKRLTKVHPLKLEYALNEVMRRLKVSRDYALKLLSSRKDLEIVRYGDELFVRSRG